MSLTADDIEEVDLLYVRSLRGIRDIDEDGVTAETFPEVSRQLVSSHPIAFPTVSSTSLLVYNSVSFAVSKSVSHSIGQSVSRITMITHCQSHCGKDRN